MIAAEATCGHYAIFTEEGEVIARSCTCAEVHLRGTPAAIFAGDLPIASRRKTSNSRGPGQEGTVYVPPGGLSRCPKCHAAREAKRGLRDRARTARGRFVPKETA